MRIFVLLLSIVLLLTASAVAQQKGPEQATPTLPKTVKVHIGTPLETAGAAVSAHGGDDLRRMRTFLVRGTVDVTGAFSYVIPASFLIAISGERYAFELNNPFQPLRQVFDGKNMNSSGYELPPVTSFGFPLLTKVGVDGYPVSDLGGRKKKNRTGFRITTPEGFYTDFVIDEKTGQIKGYESSYDIDGRTVTTSVEINELETVKGVVVPTRYSQRFDLGQMTVYAKFKTKEILINTDLADSVFSLPTGP